MLAFLNRLYDKFYQHKTLRMASSLAFYTSISLAPLLILFVSWSSRLDLDVQQNLLTEIRKLIGSQGAEIFAIIMTSAHTRADLSNFASLASTAIMLITSSFVFGELRSSLNEIFETRDANPPFRGFINEVVFFFRDHALHVGLVIGFFGVLLVSLLASSFFSSAFYLDEKNLAYLFNLIFSMFAYAGTFGLMYRYLPTHRISWKNAFSGALGTSFFFLIGKELIALYLGRSGLSSAYGAAGSLVVFSTWIYYSAAIILIGAEVIALRCNKSDDAQPAISGSGPRRP